MPRQPLPLAVALCLAASAAAAEDPGPEKIARMLSGDAAGDAAANPQCRLFTPDEIAAYLGEPVQPGANAFDGRAAGVTSGDSFVKVSLAGAGASTQKTVEFLRDAVSRRDG